MGHYLSAADYPSYAVIGYIGSHLDVLTLPLFLSPQLEQRNQQDAAVFD